MSYAPMRTLNLIGQKPLPPPTLSGQIRWLGRLGALSDGYSDALEVGYSSKTLDALVKAGATDEQLEAMVSGQIGLQALQRQLLHGGKRALGQAATVPSNYLPVGTQLVYTFEGDFSFLAGFFQTWSDVVGSLAGSLSTNAGISVVGSNASSNPFSTTSGFSMTVQLLQAYTNAEMVQSVIDDAINGLTGVDFGTSSIEVGMVPTSAQAAALSTTPQPGLPGSGSSGMSPQQQSLVAAYNQNIAGAQAASASGNTSLAAQYTTGAQQILAQLAASGVSPSGSSIWTWIESNWQWIALGGGVLIAAVAIPKIARAF